MYKSKEGHIEGTQIMKIIDNPEFTNEDGYLGHKFEGIIYKLADNSHILKAFYERHVKTLPDFQYCAEDNDWTLDQRPYKKLFEDAVKHFCVGL